MYDDFCRCMMWAVPSWKKYTHRENPAHAHRWAPWRQCEYRKGKGGEIFSDRIALHAVYLVFVLHYFQLRVTSVRHIFGKAKPPRSDRKCVLLVGIWWHYKLSLARQVCPHLVSLCSARHGCVHVHESNIFMFLSVFIWSFMDWEFWICVCLHGASSVCHLHYFF